MLKLHDASFEQILEELEQRFGAGVIAVHLPDEESTLYYWWGDQMLSLAYTARLAYSINSEMEKPTERERNEVGVTVSNEEAAPEPSYGHYI